MSATLTIDSLDDMDIKVIRAWLEPQVKDGKSFVLTMHEVGRVRTPKQRASLEVYCKGMAQKMNDAGFDMQAVMDKFPTVELENTQESVKHLFRQCAAAMYPETMGDKPSTAKLETDTIQAVYENFNKACAIRLGVQMEWPSLENQANDALIWGQREAAA